MPGLLNPFKQTPGGGGGGECAATKVVTQCGSPCSDGSRVLEKIHYDYVDGKYCSTEFEGCKC